MMEQSLLLNLSSPGITDSTTSRLRQELQACQNLFQAQSSLVQQYLGAQAAVLAKAMVAGAGRVQFTLPHQVTYSPVRGGSLEDEAVPADFRAHVIGGILPRIQNAGLRTALCRKLSELERSSLAPVVVSAVLLRYATAAHMIYNLLPAGRSVTYAPVEGDDIPNQPVDRNADRGSVGKSIPVGPGAEVQVEKDPGELTAPFIESVRHFYLPQWVAFDGQDRLLLSSVGEAEADISSMQHYLAVLESAVVIAPYMVADDTCQQKRYSMLGQLVNQGRALARFQTRQMIHTIQRRAAEHKMDRGLRLSLPYFDDQKLGLEKYDFIVIPAGWVMFIPAFAVIAAREQKIKVADNSRLSYATRRHLIGELSELEMAFTGLVKKSC